LQKLDAAELYPVLKQSLFGSEELRTDTSRSGFLSAAQIEGEHIQRVLDEHGGNISLTAQSFGMYHRALQRKLLKNRPT